MATYDTAPSSTRLWYQSNLDRYVLPAIGRRSMADVTPTDISRMLNGVREAVSVTTADKAQSSATRRGRRRMTSSATAALNSAEATRYAGRMEIEFVGTTNLA